MCFECVQMDAVTSRGWGHLWRRLSCLLLKEVNNGRGLTLQLNMDLFKVCLLFQSLLHMVAVLKQDVQTQPERGPILNVGKEKSNGNVSLCIQT